MQERVASTPPLRFEGLLVIVGGGSVDYQLMRDLKAAGAHLVGADCGGDEIVKAGLFPEAILGDFDSLANPGEWLGRTRLIRLEEQQTTDFEKALYCTHAPVTIALGMTGRRFDHTLAAVDAVTRYAHDRIIILVDEADLAMAITGRFTFEVDEADRVSVYPLAPIRFRRSFGLEYPLDGLRLAAGERIGTSNVAVDGVFSIEPEPRAKAPWLLILDRKYLFAVAAAATARG